MAIFHAFINNLRLAQPISPNGVSYRYRVEVDLILLDHDDNVLMPYNSEDLSAGIHTLASNAAVQHNDSVAALRTKALVELRIYYPQIDNNDTIVEHWLDDKGAL